MRPNMHANIDHDLRGNSRLGMLSAHVRAGIAVAVMVSAGLLGCSRSDSAPRPQEPEPMTQPESIVPKTAADRMMQSQIDAANRVAEALESHAPETEIARLNEAFERACEAWSESDLDPQQVSDAMERYREMYDQAIRRLTKASMKGGTEAL